MTDTSGMALSVVSVTIPLDTQASTESGIYTMENDTSYANTTSENNATSAYVRDENLAKIEIAVQAVILILAITGNSVVLLVLGTRRKKLSRMNMMIVHLSLADLFVAFFNILPQLIWDITYRFHGGEFLCRTVKYFQVVAMYASSYVLVSTAVDRYLAICHPLSTQTWTNRKTHLLVALAWCFSLVFSIPQLTIFAYREVSDGVYDCWAQFSPMWTLYFYVTWVTVAIYIIPTLLLIFAYGRICYVVWRSMRMKEPSIREKKVSWRKSDSVTMNGGTTYTRQPQSATDRNGYSSNNPRAHVRGLSNAKVKTVKLTLCVILCYLVCWGPFFVCQMWSTWDINAPFEGKAMTIILLLASLNSCTNPWIYLAFSDVFYRQLVTCCGLRGRQRHMRASHYDSESRMRSTIRSSTEVTRMDSVASSIPLTDKY